MRRISNRAWIFLILAVTLAVTASAAGLVLSLHAGSRAQPAAAAASPAPQPGTAQARADLTTMQSLLNSGSMQAQAALLAPPVKFVPGSGPIVPAGKTIKVLPETFHSNGQYGTVKASVSDKTTVTLDLYLVQGHWRLYDVTVGSAATTAKVTHPGPARAQLLVDAGPNNTCPTSDDIGAKTPVILVHGFGEQKSTWSDGGATSMFAKIHSINGVWITSFDYKPTDHEWVDNPENGPALANYIHCAAQASAVHGTGKVVLVTFSMGGLLARYAATTGGDIGSVAGDIGMVVTIGAPNTGSFAADLGVLGQGFLCDRNNPISGKLPPDLCTQWKALDGMSVFSPQLWKLGELPPSIQLHEIAGEETYVWQTWAGEMYLPFNGDGAVTPGSALHKRPGWMNDTFDPIKNPLVQGDLSAFHLQLTHNTQVQQLVYKYINLYVQANQPTPSPVLGAGDECNQAIAPVCTSSNVLAYWLADGGQWFSHNMTFQVSRGAATNSESDLAGLIGTWSWNDYQGIVWGHENMRLSVQPDGSLSAVGTGPATYTQNGQPAAAGYQPQPDAPGNGMTISLMPVAPGHAQIEGPGYWAGTNWCQAGLANATQYCGA